MTNELNRRGFVGRTAAARGHRDASGFRERADLRGLHRPCDGTYGVDAKSPVTRPDTTYVTARCRPARRSP